MKKNISLLLGLAIILLLTGCSKNKITCTITSPKDGAEVSINEDLVVAVEANDTKGTIAMVIVYLGNTPFSTTLTAPYTATIPSIILETFELGKHTLKAVATNTEGTQGEASISITLTDNGGGGGGGTDDESPDFVTFANGKIPSSWRTTTWIIDNAMGYDDDYSLMSNNTVASVVTNKTMNAASYVEFYIRNDYGDYFELYIDGNKATALSAASAGNAWKKWIYAFDKGRHSFRWQNTDYATIHLDAIKFAEATLPQVTTNANVTYITATSATSGGNVTNNGNHTIIARGVCWSTSENPTIDDNKTTDGTAMGNFTSNISGLTPNTTYYVRAYVTNSVGTVYGEQKSFTTKQDDGVEINGVIWAIKNVNLPGTFVENPENTGMFYQWNRKTGWSSTDPMINSNSGTTWDNSTPTGATWEKSNDPCPAGWRVPTQKEQQSLLNSGSFWGELNGVSGRFFGNGSQKVFFPAVSYRHNQDGTLTGNNGYYWSGTPFYANTAYCLYFSKVDAWLDSYKERSCGVAVRCVAE